MPSKVIVKNGKLMDVRDSSWEKAAVFAVLIIWYFMWPDIPTSALFFAGFAFTINLAVGMFAGSINLCSKISIKSDKPSPPREGEDDLKLCAANAALERVQEPKNLKKKFLTLEKKRNRNKHTSRNGVKSDKPKPPREGEDDLKFRAANAALERLQQPKNLKKKLLTLEKKRNRNKLASIVELNKQITKKELQETKTKKRRNRNELASIVELNKRIAKKEIQKTNVVENSALVLANQSLVYDNGLTVFRIIPTLPSPDKTTEILSRIAREFLPIIKRRGYRIRSVSEYYHEHGFGRGVDSDGLDFELGGFNRSAQPGDIIDGHDMSTTLGYNCLLCRGRGHGRFRVEPDHTIHLRLREANSISSFRPYDDVVRTMAHELAHCVHRNHQNEFWELTKEILNEYEEMYRNSQSCHLYW